MTDPCPVPISPPPPWTPQPAGSGWAEGWCHAPTIPAPDLAGLVGLLAHAAAFGLWLALAYVVIRANFGHRITDWWRPVLTSGLPDPAGDQ